MSDDPSLDPVDSDFIEKIGLCAQTDEPPYLAGRAFGVLINAVDVVPFDGVATQSTASRSHVGSRPRIFAQAGSAKRIRRPHEPGDFFELALSPRARSVEGIQKRNGAIREDIAETIQHRPSGADAGGCLTEAADFYAVWDTAVASALNARNFSTDPKKGQRPAAAKDLDR